MNGKGGDPTNAFKQAGYLKTGKNGFQELGDKAQSSAKIALDSASRYEAESP